jgi:sugar phosphate isomerase/epimerase
MPRPVLLFSGPFADLPLADLAAKASEWGYAGLELCSWGDHFEVQRALAEADYCAARVDLLNRHELQVPVVAAHRVGQALCDPIDARHRGILPDYVWGDGDAEGVRQRAAEELADTLRAAQQLGAATLNAFAGSPLWSYVAGWPAPSAETVSAGLREFARRIAPVLDACRETGLRFALEVHPAQVAFDLHSAEAALDVLDGPEEFGFTVDPAHLHWQGVSPAEFVRRFRDHIFHVHVKDAALSLDGRSGILNGYLQRGDPRRGWDFRSPGHGGVEWEGFVRSLNEVGYTGPLSVDWTDPGMDREYGAADACQFVKRLDFDPPRRAR